MSSSSPRIMLAGGGTGGHVYPLLAIVESLTGGTRAPARGNSSEGQTVPGSATGEGARATINFHFLGSERSESRIIPDWSAETGIPIEFHQIDIRFSYRWPTPRNWGYYRRNILPLLGGRPFRQALSVLEQVRPAVLLASGGYVSAPALWAARKLGIPYALLQLDGAVGLVNAYFASSAARVYVSTAGTARALQAGSPAGRVVLAGYPARRARLTRAEVFAQYGFDPARKLLVIMGGSLGTGAIAGLAAEMVEKIDTSAYADKIAIIFSAGERMDTARAIEGKAGKRVQFAAVSYIGDSVSVLAAADFYVGRSGASTVAELVSTGPQCLLVPDPQHRDRQQYTNAAQLVARGQGELLEQREANGEAALAWLGEAWDRPRVAPPDPPAAEVIAADLINLMGPRPLQ